jgi:hypothetical protein
VTTPLGVAASDTVRPGSRADRLTRPRARDVVTEAAVNAGVCIRPVLLRRTDTTTGETQVIETRCGSTRSSVCPPCADRARRLRAQQCREGWHLEEEPHLTPRPADPTQQQLLRDRAILTAQLDAARDAVTRLDPDPLDVAWVQELTDEIATIDAELAATGARGTVVPPAPQRKRSTRRRHDVPDLPRRAPVATTLGRTFTDPRSGRTFRPSLFVTLTLPGHGRVLDDGTPADPGRYAYRSAARDALHFGKLVDRWVQNLRRVAGYDVQYFAAVEPQKRGAPHIHVAIRGTLPRAVVRELTAATYTNVWWPSTDTVHYADPRIPVWDDQGQQYLDPDSRAPLPTWEQALEDLDADPDAQPLHTVRFGRQVDVKGVLAGSPEAEKAIGYLVKYLVKDLGDDLDHADDLDPDEVPADVRAATRARQARRADHIARLVEALRFEPCSPRCANWLRYGIQPMNPRPGLRPGCCKAKAHRPSHLGYGGRRVLVSRKWTAKDLRDHRHDRRDHVHAVLAAAGITPDPDSATRPPEPGGVTWEKARPTDPDIKPRHHRLLTAIALAHRRRAQYHAARTRPGSPGAQRNSATAPDDTTAA